MLTPWPLASSCRIARHVVASDRSQDLLDNVVHNATLNSESLDGGETRLTTTVRCQTFERFKTVEMCANDRCSGAMNRKHPFHPKILLF